MNENISSAANEGNLPPPGTSDDLQVLIARARTAVDSISEQVQEVAANAATVTLAKKQAADALTELRTKQEEITTAVAGIGTAKTDLDGRIATVAAQVTEIEGARKHADQTRSELDGVLAEATQHATNADAFKKAAQSASEESVGALNSLQAAKTAAQGDKEAIATARTEATAAAEVTKSLAARAETIEQRVATYEDRLKELEAQCAIQLKAIDDLLPGATSAGLATAFDDRRKTFLDPGKHWQWIFVGSLVALTLLAGTALFHSFFSSTTPTLESVLVLWLTRLPVAVTLAWLALHASRETALAKRLEEDYGFKAVTAASFQGFHKRMTEMGAASADNAPLSKLCEGVLATIANPPGRIYEKHELSVSPSAEFASAAKSATDVIKAAKSPLGSGLPGG